MENKITQNFHRTIIVALVGLLLCHFPYKAFAENFTDTSSQHHKQEQSADKKIIRDFVLYNYAHVVNDIVNGEGIYIDTLYGLLGIEEDKKMFSLKNFIDILLENKRIPEFSNCIAGYSKDC